MKRVTKPTMGWRIVRGGRSNYATESFATKEERDRAGAEWAALDHEDVLLESWSAAHSQDDLNQGWALDDVAYPPGKEPEPETRARAYAKDLKPGQSVSVWGFPTIDPSGVRASFVDGIVGEVLTAYSPTAGESPGFLSTRVEMEDGQVAFCVPDAIAYFNEES